MAKYQAVLDEGNFRYIITPLRPGETMDVKTAVRAMKESTLLRWHDIAKFLGLRNASVAFRVAYLSNIRPEVVALEKFLTIDVDGQKAYLYDCDHKPSSVERPYVGPEVAFTDSGTARTVTALVPAVITSGVKITDTRDRRLELILTPTNGSLTQADNNGVYGSGRAVRYYGTAANLTAILRKVRFVGDAAGEGAIDIVVKDYKSTEPTATASLTVTCHIVEGEVPSIPEIHLPDSAEVTLNKRATFGPITVTDADNKVMTVRITPFYCRLYDFATVLGVVNEHECFTIQGVPEYINNAISKVTVIPLAENASLCVEVFCGTTRLRDYLIFDVSLPEDDDDEKEEGGEEEGDKDEGGDGEHQPPQPPVAETVTLAVAHDTIAGLVNSSGPLGITIGGNKSGNVTVKITPTNCSVKGITASSETVYTAESPYTFTGSLTDAQTQVANAQVVVGGSNGSVAISVDDQQKQINITSETLDLATSNASVAGNEGSTAALGATLSGNYSQQITATVTPSNCQIKIGEGEPTSDQQTKTDTVANINAWLGTIQVVFGAQNGTVQISCLNQNKTVEVQVAMTLAQLARARAAEQKQVAAEPAAQSASAPVAEEKTAQPASASKSTKQSKSK